jgi:hypothetical protein
LFADLRENTSMRSDELFDEVKDRDTFLAFVRALADEREEAEKLEQAEPQRYTVDGANQWKNSDIASFLYAALNYFDEKPFHKPEKDPSWRMFADFLYHGKIIE